MFDLTPELHATIDTLTRKRARQSWPHERAGFISKLSQVTQVTGQREASSECARSSSSRPLVAALRAAARDHLGKNKKLLASATARSTWVPPAPIFFCFKLQMSIRSRGAAQPPL